MAVNIQQGTKGLLIVRFPYSKEAVNKMRLIEGRKWHPKEKFWTVPADEKTRQLIKSLFLCECPELKDKKTSSVKLIDEIDGTKSEETERSNSLWISVVLPKMTEEIQLKGHSPKTTVIYTHVCEKDIQRIRSPMDDFMTTTKMVFPETPSETPSQKEYSRNRFEEL